MHPGSRFHAVVRSLFLILLLFGLTPVASAQTGTVSGTITNAGTGTPLSGVLVQILNGNGAIVAQTAAPTTGTGTYTTPAVAPGSYFIRTSSSGGFLDKVHATGLPGPNAGDVDCY